MEENVKLASDLLNCEKLADQRVCAELKIKQIEWMNETNELKKQLQQTKNDLEYFKQTKNNDNNIE